MEDWARANEHWVTLTNKDAFDGDLLERIQYTGSLGKLLKECKNDENVRKSVEEFVRKAIRYSQETGKIIDIIGAQNAFINFNDDIVLHDALYTENSPILEGAAKLFHKIAAGKQPTAQEWYTVNDLANALNYVRGINAIAHALGMPDRLDIFRSSKPIQWNNLLKVLQDHWRMFASTRLDPVSIERKYRLHST